MYFCFFLRKILSTLIKNIAFLFISIFFLNYQIAFSQNKNTYSKLNQILWHYRKEDLKKYSIVIVNSKTGCPTCTEAVDDFVLDHLQIKKLLLVVTSHIFKKTFEIKFSVLLNKERGIILDQENYSYNLGIIQEKPKLFILKNGIIVSEKEITNIKSELGSILTF